MTRGDTWARAPAAGGRGFGYGGSGHRRNRRLTRTPVNSVWPGRQALRTGWDLSQGARCRDAASADGGVEEAEGASGWEGIASGSSVLGCAARERGQQEEAHGAQHREAQENEEQRRCRGQGPCPGRAPRFPRGPRPAPSTARTCGRASGPASSVTSNTPVCPDVLRSAGHAPLSPGDLGLPEHLRVRGGHGHGEQEQRRGGDQRHAGRERGQQQHQRGEDGEARDTGCGAVPPHTLVTMPPPTCPGRRWRQSGPGSPCR